MNGPNIHAAYDSFKAKHELVVSTNAREVAGETRKDMAKFLIEEGKKLAGLYGDNPEAMMPLYARLVGMQAEWEIYDEMLAHKEKGISFNIPILRGPKIDVEQEAGL